MTRYNRNYDGYGGVNSYPRSQTTIEEIRQFIKGELIMPDPEEQPEEAGDMAALPAHITIEGDEDNWTVKADWMAAYVRREWGVDEAEAEEVAEAVARHAPPRLSEEQREARIRIQDAIISGAASSMCFFLGV